MQRCIYAIPSASFLHSDEMLELQKDAEESQLSPADLRAKLQVRLSILVTYVMFVIIWPLLLRHLLLSCFC